ncbi:MAG: hypothetical protein FVQ77_09200 [Cytophagales bacterium]|nr:hypothetical protein [Cytophagales bacterium]
MEFRYKKESTPIFGEILMPLIEFGIKTNTGWVSALGCVDSGADITLLPLSFIRFLGIRIEDEEIKGLSGVGRGGISVIIKEVELKIANVEIKSNVAIALTEQVPYLLGRKDIFNKFKIIFEEYNQKIIFEKIQTLNTMQ